MRMISQVVLIALAVGVVCGLVAAFTPLGTAAVVVSGVVTGVLAVLVVGRQRQRTRRPQ